MLNRFIYGVDQLSRLVGHAFAWLIIILMLGTCYEVFVRYVLGNPTSWAFDMSYIVYGGLFLMAGAYTLSRNGHVRGDVLYRLWPARVQASVSSRCTCSSSSPA
jgi:TRAP-type mannitol/chloroaromatic compound transport system permease small subunit